MLGVIRHRASGLSDQVKGTGFRSQHKTQHSFHLLDVASDAIVALPLLRVYYDSGHSREDFDKHLLGSQIVDLLLVISLGCILEV